MVRRIITALMGTVLFINGGDAQINQAPSECRLIWGEPISGRIDTNGLGSLSFHSEGVSIEIGFWDGIAHRIVYRLLSSDETALNHFLLLNGEGVQWLAWNPPGPIPMAPTVRRWMRSDETVMAQLSSNALTVRGPKWAQYHEATQSSEDAGKTAIDKVQPPVTNPPPPTPPVEIERVAAMPLKPSPPANLPVTGDSREQAIRLLGNPDGRIHSGKREVLIYPWGNIWIENGKVTTF